VPKLSKQHEEGEGTFTQLQNKSIKRCETADKLLDMLDTGRRSHVLNHLNFLHVDLNSSVQTQETKKLSTRNPKNTFLTVKHHVCGVQSIEDLG
jgi:hypothetical protein